MRRILIDDRIKKLAAEYVKKLPLVVGDVKADLQILADDLKKKVNRDSDMYTCISPLQRKVLTH